MKFLIFTIFFAFISSFSVFAQETEKPKMTWEIYNEGRLTNSDEQKKRNAELDSLLHTQATDFKFATISGDSIQLSALRGKVVFLNFFFTLCSPCIKEMPLIKELSQTYQNKKVVVISISLKDTKEGIVYTSDKYAKGFAESVIIVPASAKGDKGDGYIINFDKSKPSELTTEYKNETLPFLSQYYKISSAPVNLIIDKKGVIRQIITGFDNKYDHFDFYTEAINQLLREKE